ncbi:hypothetical protein MED121_02025 [Marinomonas sp. MED121]|uniref:helix-turn-helix domain-containing protein n=1 Tax=Marinomonas sp. MED121 TaxID=314277 RepID=UPI0000690AB8|nr:helix-turn-helix domain-containing protein [Marinomonas sp. MED121]EAQ65950.1 hypothetical protein MED121_02025 [Marinomonas sp. MED121]
MSKSEVCQKTDVNGSDWHRADIIAALKKRKLSVRELSRRSGLKENTLANALRSPWPKGEKIIADAIDTTPQEIWPSRYSELQAVG